MANASAHKKLGSAWSNEEKVAEFEYDFSNDAGAVGTVTLGDCDQKMLITQAIVFVETACTSGGSATVIIGPSSNTDAFLDITSGAVGNLTDNATVIETTGIGSVVESTETFVMTIATAALTAGKIKVYLKYRNVA